MRESHLGLWVSSLNTTKFSKKKDFLGAHKVPTVQQELSKFGESEFEGDCLSDFVFLFDKKLNKKRIAAVVTKLYICMFEIKSWKLIYLESIKNLLAISIASKNCTVMSLHFKGPNRDLLLESYRRIDLILYIARSMKENNVPLFKLRVRKNFKATGNNKDQQTDEPKIETSPEKMKKELEVNFLQETIRNCRKSGFLKIHKKSFFGQNSFVENFCIVTNLGLVLFKGYGDKKATGFIPILGGSVVPQPKKLFGKDNVFSVKFPQDEVVVQAVSSAEMEEWIAIIKDLQDKCLTAKDTIKEIGKVL